MQVYKTSHPAPGEFEITLTADAAEFELASEQVYQTKKATYALAGYETGSVPRTAMLAHEGKHFLWMDAVQLLLAAQSHRLLCQTLDEAQITAVDLPILDLTRCSHAGFAMDFRFNILPAVTLGQYQNITLRYPKERAPADAAAARQGATLLLLEDIGQRCQMQLSDRLVAEEYHQRLHSLKYSLAQRDCSLAQHAASLGKTQKELEADCYAAAERTLRAQLAALAIAQQEEITASTQEIEAETLRLAASMGKSVAAFQQETLPYLVAQQLILQRVTEWLLQANTLLETEA